jgi:hypothetical protein
MNKLLLFILLTTSLIAREYITIIEHKKITDPENENQVKVDLERYICVGFLDHKTGNSLLGYARTIIKHEKHEMFVGIGTLIAANTLSIGWKYYLLDSPIQSYSVLSMQASAGMGGSFIAPFMSLGIEKSLTKKLFFNLGLNATIRIYSHRPIEIIPFPNININYRY